MKKVGCLYRVSTYKQAYQNDIPVQKEACKKFIKNKKDWIIEKEYIELGVSGYKVSEKKRDAIQEVKQDVLDKKIDILLVFMFDRIGRREEETPLVVRWLIDQGIEVWSVNEGQRTINDRYDRLLNYITYWQAEGESEKISLRATERRIQLIKDGIYMGNYAPYGYILIDSNETTKIGKIRKKLKIYPKEAKIIELIFYLLIDLNYGTDKIAIYLNKYEFKRRKENRKWDNGMILEIVRNPIYKGYVSFRKRNKTKNVNERNNKSKWIMSDKPNEEIIIISEDRWNKANDILDARSRKGKRVLRLLSGLTRCGYCKDYIVPKGKSKYIYMKCKGKQKTGYCEYEANYRLDKLEEMVNNEIKKYLLTIKKIDLRNIVRNNNKKINMRKEKLVQINKKESYLKNRLEELKNQVANVLMQNDINLINKIGSEIKTIQYSLNEQSLLKLKYENEIFEFNEKINSLKELIPNWIKEYDIAPLDKKRMIVNKLIEKIYLYNDRIEILVKYPITKLIVKGKKNND